MTLRKKIPHKYQRKLQMLNIKEEILEFVPESMARTYKMIPLGIRDNALELAMADAMNIIAIDALSVKINMRIQPEQFEPQDIQDAIDYYYGPSEDSSFDASSGNTGATSQEEIAKLIEKIQDISASSDEDEVIVEESDSPIVKAFSFILNDAVKRGASDIHIQPQERELMIRYRIDGSLHDVLSLPRESSEILVSRLKIMSNLNIAEHRRPQDGQFAIDRLGKNGNKIRTDVRVGIVPSTFGETAALRLHDTAAVLMGLTDLGSSAEGLAQYHQMLQVPYGMILVSGPTGAGKTTTLYSSLSSLDCRQRNVVTIEDPVEYHFRYVTQIPVHTRSGLTFAAGLRSILRVDPDVIMIGEIRDSETAQIAVQSALTGHLVLSSIHANDSVGVISRLVDLGIEPFLIASALVGIVSQRMVRKICPLCSEEIESTISERETYRRFTDEERDKFLSGVGCDMCTAGYKGRTGIFEVLRISDSIRERILNGSSSIELHSQALKEGMTPLMKAGMLKVQQNVTTPSEVLRSAFSI